MIGALVGDIVGSVYEWNNHRSKAFPLFGRGCFFTDDSIMTIAVCDALLKCRPDYADLSEQAVKAMQEIGRPYPDCGFGGRFFAWIYSDNPQPYNSFGNGSAMRVSACAWAANSLAQAKAFSEAVTKVTHNHPEGIKGAEATVSAIYLARSGKPKEYIRQYITANYYPLDFTIDEIRPTYAFNETCQQTVPQALEAFFESVDFEDAIRTAISVGGDSDTLAAITGSVAEAFYGVPTDIREKTKSYLDERLLQILNAFEERFPVQSE